MTTTLGSNSAPTEPAPEPPPERTSEPTATTATTTAAAATIFIGVKSPRLQRPRSPASSPSASGPTRRSQRLQVPQHLLRALPPVRRLLLQAAHYQFGQRGRSAVAVHRDRLGRLGHVRHQRQLRTLVHERRPTREQLVGQRAHRIDICTVIDVIRRLGLLGRHVGGRPERHPHRGEL